MSLVNIKYIKDESGKTFSPVTSVASIYDNSSKNLLQHKIVTTSEDKDGITFFAFELPSTGWLKSAQLVTARLDMCLSWLADCNPTEFWGGVHFENCISGSYFVGTNGNHTGNCVVGGNPCLALINLVTTSQFTHFFHYDLIFNNRSIFYTGIVPCEVTAVEYVNRTGTYSDSVALNARTIQIRVPQIVTGPIKWAVLTLGIQ